jgi:RNA polymerase sigma factor (sigma-70 family)
VIDQADYEAFVARTLPGMLASAIVYCRHRQNAEDAVLEAYAQAYRYWPQLTAPEAWTRTTMRRRAVKDAKKWWLRWGSGVSDVPMPSADEAVYVHEVRCAVRRLPPRQRQVVFMYYWEDKPCRQIADELGTTERGVTTSLAKARAKLAIWLGPAAADGVGGDPLVPGRLAEIGAAADPLAPVLHFARDAALRALDADAGTLRRVAAAVRAATTGGVRR